MHIDAHQHFWKYDPVRDLWIEEGMEILMRNFMPGDVSPVMTKRAIGGCVAVQSDSSEQDNSFLLELATTNHAIKGIVGWVDLLNASVRSRLEHWSAYPLMKGFRHVLQADDQNLMLDRAFNDGIAALKDFGFIYELLLRASQLPTSFLLVEKHPEVNFMLDHSGKPAIKAGAGEYKNWFQAIRKLASKPNVYCKLSGLVTEADLKSWKNEDLKPFSDAILEAFSPSRIVFGSDWPVCLLAASYDRVCELTDTLLGECSLNEKEKIMGANAINFYHLQ